MSEYNGWKNWETWNVALWLNNDEMLYASMVQIARFGGDYTSLAKMLEDTQTKTADGVHFHPSMSPQLDLKALDDMVRESAEG